MDRQVTKIKSVVITENGIKLLCSDNDNKLILIEGIGEFLSNINCDISVGYDDNIYLPRSTPRTSFNVTVSTNDVKITEQPKCKQITIKELEREVGDQFIICGD